MRREALKNKRTKPTEFDPADPSSIVWLRRAAVKFRKAHLGSQESARRMLAKTGIYTLDGRLTKEYSS
jgi:hypothetical protein